MTRRLALDGDALGFRDALSELLRGGQQSPAIVPRPEDRPDPAQNAAGVSIRNDGFEPISNLDAILVVLDRQKDQQTVVSAFFPDAPFLEQADGNIFDWLILERVDRNDSKLCAGGTFHVAAIGFDLGRRARIDYVGKIVHVTRGLELRGVER